MDTECFDVALVVLFNIQALANLLNGVLLGQPFQVEGLQLENILADGDYLEGLFALLFELEYEFGHEELS